MLQLAPRNGAFPADAGITSAPAIIGDKVYVSSTLANKTYALNAQTGDLVWSYQTGGNIYSSPAVVNGIAYFGSYDGNLYAVGQLANNSSSGISNLTYYAIVAAVIVVIVVIAAVAVLRKQHK